jgi:uncharacterized membrane protein YoaK (UPF0700 family)
MPGSSSQSLDRALYGTLLGLTFVSGLVDAASFISLGHVFAANMTGNIVFMAFAISGVSGMSFLRSFVALISGLAGGVVAGALDSKVRWRRRTAWLSLACWIEAALLAIATLIVWHSHSQPLNTTTTEIVIVLIGFAMGLRNGTVRKLAVPDMMTTALTFVIASLAFDSSIAGGTNARWQIRVASIISMFSGAALGALILRYSLTLLLAVTTVVVASLALLQIFRSETVYETKLENQSS